MDKLWADATNSKACTPTPHALSHVCVDLPDHWERSRAYEPGSWREDHLLVPHGPSHILSSYVFYDTQTNSFHPAQNPWTQQKERIRQKLVQGLQLLGTELGGHKLSNLGREVVQWVCAPDCPEYEDAKHHVRAVWSQRKCWRRNDAYEILQDIHRSRCYFLRLPKTLRSKLYEHDVPRNQLVDVVALSHDPLDMYGWSKKDFLPNLPPIMQLRHKISDEARTVYFENNTFYASMLIEKSDLGRLRRCLLKL